MSQNIFKTAPLSERSFFQKIFNQYPEENIVIELNNVLATKSVLEITNDEINKIKSRYNIQVEKEFHLNIEEFYAVYLNHCFKDRTLTNLELQELKHLKQLLNLDDKTIDKLHTKIGELVYKKSFKEAVSDGRLTAAEEAFLNELETNLKLPKQLSEKISADVRTSFIQNYVTDIISDQRLSPYEEEELEAIAASLNVNVQHNEQTKQQLEKLKLYWALENVDLPAIQTDIVLQKSEKCFIQINNVNWYELRAVRRRSSYTGYSTSIKVAKGFYLKSGSYSPRSYSTDEMQLIDSGNIYLTNKRIIFTGNRKNSNIRIDKILNINPVSDGLEIDKETGKSPFLQLPNRADIFCIILERLLREKH